MSKHDSPKLPPADAAELRERYEKVASLAMRRIRDAAPYSLEGDRPYFMEAADEAGLISDHAAHGEAEVNQELLSALKRLMKVAAWEDEEDREEFQAALHEATIAVEKAQA